MTFAAVALELVGKHSCSLAASTGFGRHLPRDLALAGAPLTKIDRTVPGISAGARPWATWQLSSEDAGLRLFLSRLRLL